MASSSSPASITTGPSPSGSRIGRPPQWTVSRSRKLARLYLYTTLSIEKIIKVLEEDTFKPRKNSAQKTIHKMLDNDPRYLRPESRIEMAKRINNLCMSPTRRRRPGRPSVKASPSQLAALEFPDVGGQRLNGGHRKGGNLSVAEASTPGSSHITGDAPWFEFVSPVSTSNPPARHTKLPAAFRGQVEQSIDATDSSQTDLFVQEVKRRISDCSSHYAAQISTLVEEFTIVETSEEESSARRPSVALSEVFMPEQHVDPEPTPEAFEAFPEPGFALPGDFLSAHTRNCADFPGQQHGKRDCWCSIAEETSAGENTWLAAKGELSERAKHAIKHLPLIDASLRDSFGNTLLHVLAALEGQQDTLLRMVISSNVENLKAVNTGGQTFLHILHFEWFSELSSPSSPLTRLLAHVRNSCPDLVCQTDVYGRNFFHRAHSIARDPRALAGLIFPFEPLLVSGRDAFGFNPVSDSRQGRDGLYIPPRRLGSLSPPIERLAKPNRGGSWPTSSADEGSFLAYHARLVNVIQSSYNNPNAEDPEGRNGLHCLAEAILNQQTMDRHVQVQRGVLATASSTASSPSSYPFSRPHLKRKLTDSITEVYPLSPGVTSGASSPSPQTPPAEEGSLPTRLRHLQGLLHPSVNVDVHHYDRRGTTPLMAFIEHISDDQDDKAKTLQTIIETLIRAGGPRCVEARNRRAETPLLLAARLGRKVALAVLLEHGANVHVRDVDGRGLLEVLDSEVDSARARSDVSLYARLEACRVLLTGRRDWGVQYKGGIVREWRVRE
ncbi:hypothetical protein N656DRAFT_755889 [Canariomyces notabilis]|uniref:Ankyrin repeat protein n=1 Tax=Canariomyces notabilis TaxID=2074819 RepID=A0AAN6QKH0_9PEZI|nr:hypothetical protein N656DRAFT_755889 [Canariomyces arenarius]